MIGRMRRGNRLGIALLGNRLTAAVVRRGRVSETFSIVDAEQPGQALRAELESRGLRLRTARLGLHRGAVVVKGLDLPAAVDGELADLVRFELERHVPFAAEDAAFDFAPLPGTATGRRVLVVAAERRTVERALQVLAETKTRPVSLTVAAHDLVALLGRRPRGERAVWVHRVGDSADLLLVAGNALLASRSLPGRDAAALAAEIRGSLAMVRWSDCHALWISGDGAAGIQDSPALGALGLPIAPPPLSARARRALDDVADADDGAGLLAAAVALGRRGRHLDLLPVTLRPRRLTRDQWITVGLASLTLALGLGALFAEEIRDRRYVRRLEAEIRRLDPQVHAVQGVMDELERQRRLLATIQGVAAGSLRPLPFLRELTEALPPDVWLTALNLDQKAAELTGQAAAASTLIPLLENSPRLERVEFASPVTRGRDKEQFRIRAAWEGTAASDSLAPPAPARPPAARAELRRPESPTAGEPMGPPAASSPGPKAPPRGQP
jgi:Tfp pilus assembly protein PilN